MYSLEKARLTVERLTNGVANAMRVEVAVFDENAKLIYGTPIYLRKKGSTVHAPAIQEVLSQGSVVFNAPGQRESCAGCRFKDHCPATVEILCCIKVEGMVIGVVSLTSFAREGQVRISQNSPTYLDAVTELATLIGDIVFMQSGDRPPIDMNHYVGGILESAKDPLLLVNANGVIIQYNSRARQSLSFCSLSAASLWHLLPEELTQKVISGSEFQEEEAVVGELRYRISAKPIFLEEKFSAAVVRLCEVSVDEMVESEFAKNIIGVGEEAKTVHFLIKKLANSPSPVLITGETGTGKELVARTIHEQSRRRKAPFVAINCSSVPENLFESELFGYEEGSFTGAKKGGKPGKFELAQGGTLFLDELGEMPVSAQPKLLRVLQDYKVERVGSTEKISLDTRIIAATNCNLSELMKEGTFRKDLYYRIAVVNIELPPLRKRQNDILPIARDYLRRLKMRMDTPLTGFDREVEQLFLRYEWPGNIRELQNVIEYTANLCENEIAGPADLPLRLLTALNEPQFAAPTHRPGRGDEQLDELLRRYGHTLEGKKRIAQELGVSLRTLYRRLERMEARS